MFSPGFSERSVNIPREAGLFDLMTSVGRPLSVKKGRAIVKEGSSDRCFFYVKDGVFKTVKNVRERRYTLGFSFVGDIACCPTSLLKGLPNNFNIEAVSNAELLVCNWKDVELYADKETYQSLVKYLLIDNLAFLEERLVDAISLNAEEGYRSLLLQYPDKVKQIPLAYVASYLGISIERLSRIRRKMKFDLGQMLE